MACRRCGSDDSVNLLICQGCERRQHMHCLDGKILFNEPILWKCEKCAKLKQEVVVISDDDEEDTQGASRSQNKHPAKRRKVPGRAAVGNVTGHVSSAAAKTTCNLRGPTVPPSFPGRKASSSAPLPLRSKYHQGGRHKHFSKNGYGVDLKLDTFNVPLDCYDGNSIKCSIGPQYPDKSQRVAATPIALNTSEPRLPTPASYPPRDSLPPALSSPTLAKPPVCEILEAPTFFPSPEQFQNPMRFIKSIRKQAEPFGICKICPPPGWKPRFSLQNQQDFSFATRLQKVHELGKARGFPSGKQYSLKHYRAMADKFSQIFHSIMAGKLQQFKESNRRNDRRTPWLGGQRTEEEEEKVLAMESVYWDVVDSAKARIEVEYGNDIDTNVQGSGFANVQCDAAERNPRRRSQQLGVGYLRLAMEVDKRLASPDQMAARKADKMEQKAVEKAVELVGSPIKTEVAGDKAGDIANAQQAKMEQGKDRKKNIGLAGEGVKQVADKAGEDLNLSCWDLNVLPLLTGSVIRHLRRDITGVTVPWLYIGMLFATFCWHNEDDYLYSISYLHTGATKSWYGVPGGSAGKMEEVMKEYLPDLFQVEPDLMMKLVTMVSPGLLRAKGVPVYHTLQDPGTYVVTFPKAFHAGFSHGWNCGEAVNFALDDWFKHGREAADRYKGFGRSSVLSLSQLLLICAILEPRSHDPDILCSELEVMRQQEQALRQKAVQQGIKRVSRLPGHSETEIDTALDDAQCTKCRQYCYLSYVQCSCSPAVFCLDHLDKLCSCDRKNMVLRYRYKIRELIKVEERVRRLTSQGPEIMKNETKKERTGEGGGNSSSACIQEASKAERPTTPIASPLAATSTPV